jgi:hypothetical protein
MTEMTASSSFSETLLNNLLREVYQTETSAVQHCKREAERLGSSSPAAAMVAISEHASRAMPRLVELCQRENLPVSAAGGLAGRLFSQVRDKLADRIVQSERSYRLTLVGIRHGIDLMRMVRSAAESADRSALSEFCSVWLDTRVVLTQHVEDEMRWFVRHPELATKLARPFLVAARRERLQHS